MTIYQDSFVFFLSSLGGCSLERKRLSTKRVPGPGALKYFTHQETHKATRWPVELYIAQPWQWPRVFGTSWSALYSFLLMVKTAKIKKKQSLYTNIARKYAVAILTLSIFSGLSLSGLVTKDCGFNPQNNESCVFLRTSYRSRSGFSLSAATRSRMKTGIFH